MIYARPGSTIEATLTNAATGLTGTLGVRIVDGAGGTTTARTTSGIVEHPAGSGIYTATIEAPDTAGSYVIAWDTGGATPIWAAEDLVVTYTRPPTAAGQPFATYEDVETRLGRTLTDAQRDTATDVIAIVQAQIIDEVDRDAAWADALDPVPVVLKALCVSKAVNAISRPEPSIAAESLGEHSVTYARETSADIFLSEPEKRLARMAVYGTLTASSTPRALHDRVIDLNEGRDVDELEV